MSALLPVRHQQQGVSLATFATLTGVSEQQLRKYAAAGRIIGARKHPLTRKWWISERQIAVRGLSRRSSSAY